MKILVGKTSPPALPGTLAPRARLTSLIQTSLRRFGIVVVSGQAGSGKTTAVLDALREIDGLAWLTIDEADESPGRLITYLEAALARTVPEVSGVAGEALGGGLPPEDGARLLSEALDGQEVTLVLDEAEHLSADGSAMSALSAFIRYLPSSVHVVVITRRACLPFLGRRLGGVGLIAERELCFTVDEASTALLKVGRPDLAPDVAVKLTGGWVAGVLFEAWKSDGAAADNDGDVLNSFLRSEIMSELTAAERDFLLMTSTLDEVNALRASGIGILDAATHIASLQRHHLPVVYSADGTSFHCHRQFREYLLTELQATWPDGVEVILRSVAELYRREDRLEEAVEAFLRIGDIDSAEVCMRQSILGVVRRGDFALASRWLAAARREVRDTSSSLVAAAALVAHDDEEYALGAERADLLRRMPDYRALFVDDPSLAARVAWCYHLMCRFLDSAAVLDEVCDSPETAAVRFAIAVDLVETEVTYADRPADTGGAADAVLSRIDLVHGRLSRLLSSQRRSYSSMRSSQLGALLAAGRLDEAVPLLNSSGAPHDWTTVRLSVELMMESRSADGIEQVLEIGQRLLARSGSPVSRMFDRVLRAEWAYHVENDIEAAEKQLEVLSLEAHARSYVRLVERADILRGRIALARGREFSAAELLRPCVEMLVKRDRLLLLPEAAVLLSEAEWRLGHADRADEIADVALDAAVRQGTDHLLLRVLTDYPAVLTRRLDAEMGEDTHWHRLGRALRRRGIEDLSAVAVRVRVQEFGNPGVSIDGGPLLQPKLAKSMELLSYLAGQGGRATRPELLRVLFEGREDESARSYLRRAVNQLRAVFEPEVTLVVDGRDVRWEGGRLASESSDFEHRLSRAYGLRGRERLAALEAALSIVAAGEFLPGVDSDWVVARRDVIAGEVVDATLAAAEVAFELGAFQRSEALCMEVCARDPYRENAWRLSMKIAAELGDIDEVIARYSRCVKALKGLGIAPAATTQRLLNALRR